MNLTQTKEPPIYLTLKEVAELLKVKPRTIYAWVSDKRIPYERKGSLLRFRLDAILAWNEAGSIEPKKRHPIAARVKCARARMPAAPVMAATGKEHDVSLQA